MTYLELKFDNSQTRMQITNIVDIQWNYKSL